MILSIETSTKICSVALHDEGKPLTCFELFYDKSHSAQLGVLIEQSLQGYGISPNDLKAVAVSEGPGSYTGLRIGLSTAKGIAFGGGIPLIGVGSLEALARQAAKLLKGREAFIIPMIDARRNEVYAEVYRCPAFEKVREVKAEIVSEGIYDEYLNQAPLYICGDGAEKSYKLLGEVQGLHDWSTIKASADTVGGIAYEKYVRQEFEDVAYFEPFYLKEFRTTVSKKNPLAS